MVFDIRGRRRHVVKVVYAILAILMAASLFLVTGAINISSIFGGARAAKAPPRSLEKQAEAIEAKLTKEPGRRSAAANLTRARISVANSMISEPAHLRSRRRNPQQLAQASEDWSKYLAAAKEPSAGAAPSVAPAMFQLAEISLDQPGAGKVKVATEAQAIVAEDRPSLGTWSTPRSTRSSPRTTKRPKNKKKKRPNWRTPSSNANPSKTNTKKSKKTPKNSANRSNRRSPKKSQQERIPAKKRLRTRWASAEPAHRRIAGAGRALSPGRMGRVGLEPTTLRLRVSCSTN